MNVASGLAVDMPNGADGAWAGQKVQQWPRNWFDAQLLVMIHRWTSPNGVKYYSLQSYVNRNLCVDVVNWSKSNGAKLIFWHCHFGANQLWTPQWMPWDKYRWINAHSQKCMDVPSGTKEWGVQLQQWQCNALDPQNFWYV